MASRPLFRRHDAATQTKYEDLKQLARSQQRVLAGTPGTLKQRTKSGNRYWVREYIRVDSRKVDEHLGPETALDDKRVTELRAEIELAKTLAAGSAQLRLLGYQRVERKPAAVLEVFFNRRLTEAGLTLVGSHAYGVLLNECGVQAAGYRTQDVDIARSQPLTIALPEELTFEKLLMESGLEFVPVPGMPSHRPSASFKLPGKEMLAVDLLVPGKKTGDVVPVKELRTHAQSIALLDFLIRHSLDGVALSPNQVIPVKIPAPERFVIHKLFSSQSRTSDRAKAGKDLDQAATLAAVLEEDQPGLLAERFRELPRTEKSKARSGARAAALRLKDAHPLAVETLRKLGR